VFGSCTCAAAFVTRSPADGEWNDLDGCDHLACADMRVVRQCRQRDRRIDAVQVIDARRLDDQYPVGCGVEIYPAGTDILTTETVEREHVGNEAGGRVLRHVAGFGDGDGDFGDAGRAYRRKVIGGQGMAFAQFLARRELQRMGQRRAGQSCPSRRARGCRTA
jgi:hypothetical protein